MNAQNTAINESPRMVSLGFAPEFYPAGTHMCYIFNDDEERRWVTARFIQSGLEANERVTYVTDTLTPDELKKSIGSLGVTLPDELEEVQYHLRDADKFLCPDGTFNLNRVLEMVKRTHRVESLHEGLSGARGTGEMSWAAKGYPGSEDLLEYEARLNLFRRVASVDTVPVTSLCQYDARRFDGATLYGALTVHPMMVVHGQVLRNPYYIEPELFLDRMTAGSRA